VGSASRSSRTLGAGSVAAVAVTAAVMLLGCTTSNGGGMSPSASGQVRVSGPARTSLLEPGDEVPSFSAPALGGGRLEWKAFRGSPVVLALWASWCPHCQQELPILAEMAGDFPDVRLVTIVCAVGRGEPSPDRFMKDRGLTFPVAVDDKDDTLALAFGIRYFPTVYFVNSDGKILRALEGEIEESTLRTLFEAVT